MFQTLIYIVFSQLAIGGLLSILFVPAEAGWKFFRFCGILCLSILVLAICTGPSTFNLVENLIDGKANGKTVSLSLLILSSLLTYGYIFSIVTDRKILQKPILFGAGFAGVAGLLTDGFLSVNLEMPIWAHMIGAIQALFSALFLGSVMFGMILGHWYLVVPSLPIHPLRSLTLLMGFSILAKTFFMILTIYLFWTLGDLPIQYTLRTFLGLRGIFFWGRLLFGIIGPFILVFLIWETVKINSTQSATGILYATSVFVLMGEFLSQYILYTKSIPI